MYCAGQTSFGTNNPVATKMQPELWLYAVTGSVGVKPVGDGVAEYELATVGGQDLREPLTQKLVEHRWGVRRVEVRRVKVEDIFSRVVSGRD